MEIYEISQLIAQQGTETRSYTEYIKHPDLSVGLYILPAGQPDPQQPHTEDEVYYVVGGRGHILVGEETAPVGPGSSIYVAAGVVHRFFDISETLTIVVFFAPAEYARRPLT